MLAILDIGQTISVLAVAATTVAVVRALSLDLRRRAREAEALARATCELVVGTAERDTLNGILGAAMQAVPATVASFIVPGDDGETLRVAAILGGPGDWVGRSYPASVGISGRAWRNGTVERVHDVTRDPDYSMWTRETRSALAVPVHQHGRARGLIYFEDRRPRHFSDRDVRLMHAFADHAWVALETEDRRAILRSLPTAMPPPSIPSPRPWRSPAPPMRGSSTRTTHSWPSSVARVRR